jgi:hypothetical protein
MPKVRPTGVTAIETMLGAVTVCEVDCDIDPNDAEILVEPAAMAVTNPVPSMVAVAEDDEPHVTRLVMSAQSQSKRWSAGYQDLGLDLRLCCSR